MPNCEFEYLAFRFEGKQLNLISINTIRVMDSGYHIVDIIDDAVNLTI